MEPSQWRQYDIRAARHSGTIHEANGVFPDGGEQTTDSTELPCFVFCPSDKDVVRDAVPGVMNADEEQQRHRRSDAKQGAAHMRAGGVRRCSQHDICSERQQNVEHPVLKLRLVCGL